MIFHVIGVFICLWVGSQALWRIKRNPSFRELRESTQGYQTIVRPLIEECRKEVYFTDEDVEAVFNMSPYYPPAARCLAACIMQKLGMMRYGQLVPPEELVILYKKLFADEPERLKDPLGVITACYEQMAKEALVNPCEVGFRGLICSFIKLYEARTESTSAVTEQPEIIS